MKERNGMLTVNELFSGIGSQSAALKRLGIDFKVVGIAEIDKYAIKSYEAIHGPVKNYGDISKIDKLDYADFWTYSFPCQDISVAGKQRGINENTRSGLLYEVEKLLYKSIMYNEQPKYLMLENVKNLVGKQFKPQFDEWLKRLDELGYNTYWKVLNAKNYGIPQNRERVFAISIRKDIDTGYEFPVGFDNGKRLKDILESEVDEKYYLNSNGTGGIIKALTDGRQHKPNIMDDFTEYAPTIDTRVGAQTHRSPYVTVEEATQKGYAEAYEGDSINLEQPNSKTRRGRVGKQVAQTLTTSPQQAVIEPAVLTPKRTEYGKTIRKAYESGEFSESRHNMTELQPRTDGVSNTLTTVQKDNYVCEPSLRIRKLTPKECFRLMGFDDEDFYKAEKVNSNTQLYKQAGNSIVVDVLYYLFKNLFLVSEV